MNSKHTPGPWIVCTVADNDSILSIEQDRSHLIDEEPSIIGEIDLQGDGIDEEVGTANAALIAAAPDLLDVAKRLDDAVGFFVAALPTNHAVAKDLIGLRDLARAAIAKAESTQS